MFRVGPDLTHMTDPRDFFAPLDWRQLDDDDLDLGGVTPLPLTLPGSDVLLAFGKDISEAYLLNRANLGGFGGVIAMGPSGARRHYRPRPSIGPQRHDSVAWVRARYARRAHALRYRHSQ